MLPAGSRDGARRSGYHAPVGWALFYMFVILKIPIALLLWLVWYAVREVPEPTDESDVRDDGGSNHPRPRPPRPPRRGPHADPLPQPPARVRVAADRQLSREHR
jgi:hypothetical protein